LEPMVNTTVRIIPIADFFIFIATRPCLMVVRPLTLLA
jgi:hypothetical protein